jgi:hypothetical protein
MSWPARLCWQEQTRSALRRPGAELREGTSASRHDALCGRASDGNAIGYARAMQRVPGKREAREGVCGRGEPGDAVSMPDGIAGKGATSGHHVQELGCPVDAHESL